ncbi:hypothetical protein BG006_006973 [Podila minutissima]|uniref:Uncharacterized protein n=1 Tax=Podila minutissima TaxID=64525 RepID=A0A9P5SIJ1_9FUNG|nr:hypothetical protein BG006_006973 [Podila minutissima]
MARQTQHAIPATELADVYVYQYPPPQGLPMAPISSPYSPPPPGQQPYSYQPSNLHSPPPPPANVYSAYPPMPVPPPPAVRPDHPPGASSSSPQYIPAQDGSASWPAGAGQLLGGSTASDPAGMPTVAPPPYTPAK